MDIIATLVLTGCCVGIAIIAPITIGSILSDLKGE